MTTVQEKITSVMGTAKNDDGGGAPFHEMPYFKTVEEGIVWAEEARKKNYPYIILSVTIRVKEDLPTGGTCLSDRYETPYLYNANIGLDDEYYQKAKGYSQFEEGWWVVIANQKILSYSSEEKEAFRIASRHSGRCLVRHVGHETSEDDYGIVEVRKRASELGVCHWVETIGF